MDAAAIKWADRLARSWRGEEPGEIRIGSEAHKRLYCRMLLDTFNPYKPSVIDWPALSDDARGRLVSLPIWDIAVQTEGRARLRVQSYADLIGDPLLKQAIELNAFEEGRHKHVLSNLVQAYGIALAPEPENVAPRDAEWGPLRDLLSFAVFVASHFTNAISWRGQRFRVRRDGTLIPAKDMAS